MRSMFLRDAKRPTNRFGIKLAAMAFFGCSLASMVGCGGGDSDSGVPADPETTARPTDSVSIPNHVAAATPQTESAINPADNPADSANIPATVDLRPLLKYDSANPLVGSWLGIANLDVEILKQRLAKADEAEQPELAKIAQTFRSYQMAMDLYSDGRMGVVIQAYIDGKEHFEQVTGTWRVTEQDGTSFVVELIEQVEGSEPNTVSVRMIVSENHDQMVRPADIDQRLLVCEPMFVFDRINDNVSPQIATGPTGSEVK